MIKKIYQISFDVDTKTAEDILGINYRKVYQQIKDYLNAEEFISFQGSVYQSINKMYYTSALDMLVGLLEKHPHLKQSIRDINISAIENTRNVNFLLEGPERDKTIEISKKDEFERIYEDDECELER